jgi:exopolysaccharide production protein ExoQ
MTPALPDTASHTAAPAANAPLALALACALLAALAAWLALLVLPRLDNAHAAALAALALAPALGLGLAARAGARAGTALALLAGAVILLSDASMPGRAGATSIDAVSVLKFGLWTLGFVVAWWQRRRLRAVLAHGPSGLLALFGLWCVLGASYSVTPAYTLAASIGFLGLWAVASSLAVSTSERQGLLVISGALMLAMAISLVMYVLMPSWALTVTENGRHLRLSGLFGSPNNLGRAAALTLLLAALLWPRLPRAAALAWLLLAAVLAGSCLWLSDSRNSMLGLAAGLGAAIFLRRKAWAAALLVLSACALLLLASQEDLARGFMGLVSRSGRLDEVTSLTGRTDIWRAVLSIIEQSPWIGHGFATTRETIPANFRGAFGWTTFSAHNLWLQAAATTGLVGLLLVLASQLGWLRDALRRPRPAREAVVVFVLVVGLVEASAMGPSVNLMSFALMWALALGATHDGAAAAKPTAHGHV